MNETVTINNCPSTNFDDIDATLIAVYWIPARATGGESEIYYRQETGKNISTNEIANFTKEINKARRTEESPNAINASNIKSVIYITWLNLKPFPDFLANVSIKVHQFQFS